MDPDPELFVHMDPDPELFVHMDPDMGKTEQYSNREKHRSKSSTISEKRIFFVFRKVILKNSVKISTSRKNISSTLKSYNKKY